MNGRDQLFRYAACTALFLFFAGTTWKSSPGGEDEKAPATISEWKTQILRWKQDLRFEPIKAEELASHEAAVEKLKSITDPLAAGVLGELLDAEDYVLIKARLIPCLANIPGNGAAKVLVKVCVEWDPILMLAAAKAISESEQPERAIPYFVKYLERPQHRDRLAYILPKTGLTDFADEALPHRLLFEALVKNLVTKDIWWMPKEGWGQKVNGRKMFDSTKTRDTSTISGKRLHQQSDPLVKQAAEEATPVIDEEGIRQVLVSWTGEDFGFDQGAWRNWHAGRAKELAKASPLAEKKPPAGKSATAEWTRKIAQWHSQLRVEPTEKERAAHQEATDALAALRDPAALPALEKALGAEKYSGIQMQLLPAVQAIGGKEAIRILVKYACEAAGETVSQKAAQLIAEMPNRDEAIPQFVRYLRGEKFQQNAIDSLALTGVTNYRSSQLPHPQLFAALVDSLLTREYEYKAGEFNYDTGLSVRPRFNGYETHRAWGTLKTTVKVAKPKQQPLVHKMLKDYSQQDYGYESSQWKKWFEEEQRRQKK